MGLIDKGSWKAFDSRDATQTPTHTQPRLSAALPTCAPGWACFFRLPSPSPLARGLAAMEKHRLQNDTILTDDAVAELLAKEASDASIKYSSLGLEAFRSAKYAFSAPLTVTLEPR